MSVDPKSSGLVVVGASAGSGKTHRLTEELTARVRPGSSDRVPVEGLVAVTYTIRAETELRSRLRRSLLEAGDTEGALSLPLAHLGTVHAVGLRLLQEHALDVGLSPSLGVLPDKNGLLLRSALERALGLLRQELDDLSHRLEIRWDHRTRRYDWLTPVSDIMDLVRANRIDPARLPEMARRSADELLALFPLPVTDRVPLEAALDHALEDASRELSALMVSSPKKVTASALADISELIRLRDRGGATWSVWAKAIGVEGGKDARDVLGRLDLAARGVLMHPSLHADLRDCIRVFFEAARRGLELYAFEKRRHAAVDYVDMIDQSLTLLQRPEMHATLAETLRFVVVDEFQDTSPLQLAWFLRLHEITGQSTWVGDPKQCIFEYAGADPGLMDAVLSWQRSRGGRVEQLEKNYRSRPQLVEACSDLFAAAFAQQGMSPSEVRVEAHRVDSPALAKLEPFGVWWLDASATANEAGCVAEGVKKLLAHPEATPVVDRFTQQVRSVSPRDVALLVATNAQAEQIAAELHARRIPVSLPRTGLLRTAEGTLVTMALRWVLDAYDTVAEAVLCALHGFDGVSPDAWLERLIRQAKLDRREREPLPSAWRDALDALRPHVAIASPGELVDRVLQALDAASLAARWPEPAQRIANLEAVRELAIAYEETALQNRETGTVRGLLLFFDAASGERYVRGEAVTSDDQFLRADDDAVTVITYHRAKGLEWPVVVLLSLDRAQRHSPFGVGLETDRAVFDPADPLGERWIRYWPYPFGKKNNPLQALADQSAVGTRVAERERRERLRLMYVGFTRARDHLVFAARPRKTGWLDELRAVDGSALCTLPPDDSGQVEVSNEVGARRSVATRVWQVSLSSDEEPLPAGKEEPTWFPRAEPAHRPSYFVTPSNTTADAAIVPWRPLEAVRIEGSHAKAISRDVDYRSLGNAIHAFFAADPGAAMAEARIELSSHLLRAAGLPTISHEIPIHAADDLRRFAERRWPDATWHHEVPVRATFAAPEGERCIEGIIDLLLDTPSGWVLIDHKTFPAEQEPAWIKKAQDFGPQLAAYVAALERAQSKPVSEVWLHFAVGGGFVKMGRSDLGER